MSHEMLRRAAEHLQNSTNPAYVEGGIKLGEVADILLAHNAIPLTDPNIKLVFSSEGSVLGPTFVARDFELDTATRRVFKDGEHVSTLTPAEFKLMERVLMDPGVVVQRENLAQYVYGTVDRGALDGLKTYIKRTRSKLPVSLKRAEEIIETVRGIGLRYNHFEKEE